MDAEMWLASERYLIDRDEWSPQVPQRPPRRDATGSRPGTRFGAFAGRHVVERGLQPATMRGDRALLDSRIRPYFGAMPPRDVTLSEIKAWRRTLEPKKESSKAGACRLLRSILQAAQQEGLSSASEDPPRRQRPVRAGGSSPRPSTRSRRASNEMPQRLKLLIVRAPSLAS